MKRMILSAFWFLYWGMCFLCTGIGQKNLAGLRSYPDAVQNIVRERLDDAPKAKSIPAILLSNLVFFTLIFSVLGLALKNVLDFEVFLPAFWSFLLLGEGLGLFDLLWRRNTRRILFPFLPEQEYYQNPSRHVSSFVRGSCCLPPSQP